ncbi:MAG: hypothetical protein M3R22_12025 [Pseudomonadota bacterium]|nr:hypothetical protein [Pseudomonadota bacterium]
MISRLASAAILAAASAAFTAPAQAARIGVDINIAPPLPRVEVVPAARPGYLWTPGYWDYRHGRHYWVGGNWIRERRGYFYTQPAWVNEGGRWRFNRGAWGRRDRDHDGVPNRFDRHPDNPYRR